MPLEERPLEGEHDCLLGLPLGPGSTDEDREMGAPGLPLVADNGLSGSVVLKLGGASREKPGISDGFQGLGLAVGDGTDGFDVVEIGCLDFTGVACLEVKGVGCLEVTGVGCLEVTGDGLETEVVLTEVAVGADGVDGRRVGVDALDVGLDGGKVGLEVGVDDLAVDLDKGVVDLDGVVDLAAGIVVLDAETAALVAETVGLEAVKVLLVEDAVAREVGVEGLDDFEAEGNAGRPVGVAGLDPGPPDDEGLRVPLLEELNPGEAAGCFDVMLLLPAGSDVGFANYSNKEEIGQVPKK